MKNKLLFILALAGSITLWVLLFYSILNVEQHLIGGQRDENGCLGPAGYTYNETLNLCVREWELDNAKREIIQENVNEQEYGLTIVDVSPSEIKLDILGEQRTISIPISLPSKSSCGCGK